MKTIFESIIKRGGYDLTATLRKIDAYHIEGKLTDEERDELYGMARGGAEPKYDTDREIERLWAAVRALQDGGTGEESGDAEIPAFVQPTGAHDAYRTGDKVVFGGAVYESVTDNNVWSPADYPAGWREVV